MVTVLLIVHGLVAVALLGAITHQVISVWAPARARPGSFLARYRSVSTGAFTNAIIVLYSVAAVLGGIVYLYFRVDIRPALEQAGRLDALGFFDLKEHFIAIGLALLPAYYVCWRQPRKDESPRMRIALTTMLAFIVWWSFLVGHVMNDIRGFG